MATFQMTNAAGRGFNMSGTGSNGWSFIVDDGSMQSTLTYDDGSLAIFAVSGNSAIDGFGVRYWSDGYKVTINDIAYVNGGSVVLTMQGLNLQTTADDLSGSAWFVQLNAGNDIFYGNDYNDFIRAGYGNDLVIGFGGNDTLLGDAGDDRLAGDTGNDFLDGGAGFDSALYLGNSSEYAFARQANGDVIVMDKLGRFGSDYLTGVEAFAFDNGTFSVDALAPLPAPAPLPVPAVTFNGTNGRDVLVGNSLNNKMFGYAGNDVIKGDTGNDYLDGGKGADVLWGGAGKDAFVFAASPTSGRDAIKDFRVVDDTIYLDNAYFTKVGGNGWLKAGAFWSDKTGKAHDANDRVIYDKDSGVLYYDADGSGHGAAVAFATIGKNLALTHKDFFIL